MTIEFFKSLYKEANGDIVLRSGLNRNAIRFIFAAGLTPNQWYQEYAPMLTNDFAGAGVSSQYDTGQDPTQAGANGLLPFPMNEKNAFYMRLFLFDPVKCEIGVGGSPTIFWLSSEWPDDAIAPNPDGTDTGWRTLYHDPGGRFTPWLLWKERPVIFEGRSGCESGLFFIGDELNGNPKWNRRLCEFGNGRFAFRGKISLYNAHKNSFAGILFRKSVSQDDNVDKHRAYAAPGLHLFFWKNGGWSLIKMSNGQETIIKQGKLSKDHTKKLQTNQTGLEVEVRTFNGANNKLEVLVEGVRQALIDHPLVGSHLGPHACLFGSTQNGWIFFGDREPFDLGIQFQSVYSSLGDGRFNSKAKIFRAPECPEQRYLYRAGLPGVFMNKTTFTGNDRRCLGLLNGTDWKDIDGIYNLWDYTSYFCGNLPANVGLRATVLRAEINGAKSPGAHLLISKHQAGANDEFVMGINPLSPGDFKQYFDSVEVEIEWNTTLW